MVDKKKLNLLLSVLFNIFIELSPLYLYKELINNNNWLMECNYNDIYIFIDLN